MPHATPCSATPPEPAKLRPPSHAPTSAPPLRSADGKLLLREWEDQVSFLHRIVEGDTDRSYGIHVARLADIPRPVLDRARQLLSELAVHHVGNAKAPKSRRKEEEDHQLQLFLDPAQSIARGLREVNLDTLTPMQALDLLRKLKQDLG